MTTNGQNGQSADSFNGALGPLGPYALGPAMYKVDTIRKLDEPDPMVHRRSLGGHSPSLRTGQPQSYWAWMYEPDDSASILY